MAKRHFGLLMPPAYQLLLIAMAYSFPSLKPYIKPSLETILPSQIYILDLLPAAQCEKLLAWCKEQDMEGPKPAKRGEAERTSRESVHSIRSVELMEQVERLCSRQKSPRACCRSSSPI